MPHISAYPIYMDEDVDLSQFSSFEETYHRLMNDITILNSESMDLVFEENDTVKSVYVSRGFARNEIFVSILSKNQSSVLKSTLKVHSVPP